MKRAIGIALLIATSGSVQAGDSAVKQRQTGFEAAENGTDKLEALIDAGDWQQSAALAQQLHQQVEQLQVLFPAHSKGKGRSRDKVWDNWSDFSSRLEELSGAYKTVATSAGTGNPAQAATRALDAATSTCRSCHMKYRSLW